VYVPERYILTLSLDPKKDYFEGEVRIIGNGKIELDADGLEILYVNHPYTYDGKRLVAEGEDYVKIKFRGRYREDLLGPYKTKDAVVTQFEENYARRMFPCVDRPDMKAVFEVTIRAPKGYEVIFNTLPESIKYEGGEQVVKFKPTPPMPTYLLFFGVGKFKKMESGRLRVFTLVDPSSAARALHFASETLRNMEQWTGIAYPLEKLDLIAVPDFVFGAMENWGAMLFRESALLLEEKSPTRMVFRVGEVVAHETVHQWFGNLVSPKSWKDIWLNESFATYISHIALDSIDLERLFPLTISEALTRDSLPSTVPIELEGESEEVINANTSPIIYSKGASVLKMLHDHLGPTFWEAVAHYLKAFAYSNASTQDFWNIFKKFWEGTEWFVDMWIRRKGHPIVIIENGEAHLETFSFFGSREGTWKIPSYTNGPQIIEEGTSLEAPPRPGPFRVFYRHLPSIPPAERWKIIEDYFAFVIEGRVSLDEYFRLAEKLYTPDLAYVAVLARQGILLKRLKGASPEEKVFRPGEGEGLVKSIIMRRLIELGNKRAISEGLEMYEEPADGDEWEVGLWAHFREGGDYRKELEGAHHEGIERIVLEAAAATTPDPMAFLDFVLTEIPKAKRIYPLAALVNNTSFEPAKAIKEYGQRLIGEVLKHHLRYVVIHWFPTSRLSRDEMAAFFEEWGDSVVRDYVLELTEAYRRF